MSKKKKILEEETNMEDPIRIQPRPISPNMVNTITLSTDMTTLYLIEGNNRVIPYSLHAIGGVYIGLIGGQLTVVSALEPMPDPGTKPILAATNRSITATEEPEGRPIRRVKSVKLDTKRAQWSALFVRQNLGLVLIGATDIDVSRPGESDDLEAEGYVFDLREGYVNIRKAGDSLIAVSVPTPSL